MGIVKPHCGISCQPTGLLPAGGLYTISSSDTTQRFQQRIIKNFTSICLKYRKVNRLFVCGDVCCSHTMLPRMDIDIVHIASSCSLMDRVITSSLSMWHSVNYTIHISRWLMFLSISPPRRSSRLKAVVNWCQSNPEYTLMESIYQPDNKNKTTTRVIQSSFNIHVIVLDIFCNFLFLILNLSLLIDRPILLFLLLSLGGQLIRERREGLSIIKLFPPFQL